jgi:hypothetical protein
VEGAADDGRLQAVSAQRARERHHQDAAAELLAQLHALGDRGGALPWLEGQAAGGLIRLVLVE